MMPSMRLLQAIVDEIDTHRWRSKGFGVWDRRVQCKELKPDGVDIWFSYEDWDGMGGSDTVRVHIFRGPKELAFTFLCAILQDADRVHGTGKSET